MPQAFASTRISEVPTRSRADGVTIVFGPIWILRLSRIASRTSSSQTTLTGGGGAANDGGGAALMGHSVVSQPGVALVRRAPERASTSAAAFGGRGRARGRGPAL